MAPGGADKRREAEVAAAAGPPADPRLSAELRRWRDETARAQNVPGYLVLNNATLESLATARPRSLDELAGVKGMGPAKVRQFGEVLLRMLGGAEATPVSDAPIVPPPEAKANVSVVEPAAEPAASPVVEGSGQPSHYWTWRLLSAGFTPEDCAEIRGLALEVVLDHALRAADAGLEIDAGWFLSADAVAEIRRVIGPEAPARIRPLLDKLPRGTRYEDVQLVAKSKCRAAK
jgi:ATP-dependent DNA helicase RecQ